MNRSTIDLWVGIFVALGLGAILFLSLKVGNLLTTSHSEGYRIEAAFDNIGGLKVRAPVRTAGVVVGRIRSITLDPKTYQGVVAMDIERRYRFPKDSAAKILTSGLLGDQYVGLEPGGDDKDLAPGDTLAQTQSAVVLENLIGQFLTGKAADAATTATGATGAASAPEAKK